VNWRAISLALLLIFSSPATFAQLKSGDNPQASEMWRKVRASLYADRSIAPATADVLTLEAPLRAVDSAVVPIAIRTQGSGAAAIKRVTLIIDNNPSPIAAIFDFGIDSPRADIETRVRVDEYSHVRAVAELADGRIVMATRFVKASGGCSAPPDKDPALARASLGRMLLRVEEPARRGQPTLAQLSISHPNDSGMVMDQLSRQYTPSHYLRQLTVTYAGALVLSADLDFAISENPNFRFYFVPRGDAALKAEITDTRQLHFESTLALVTQP
jgi:sulfur-oxidizing protein SoxY